MINDETRRKLREMNFGEAVAGLEAQQSDPATVSLPFDERIQSWWIHLSGEIQQQDTATYQSSTAAVSPG